MEEILNKKEQLQQKKQEQKVSKEHAATVATRKRFILFSLLILVVVGMIWAVAASQKRANEIVDLSPDPSIGPDTAPVRIKEYSDFQCPACAGAYPVVKSLLKEYGDKVRFEYNDFPLSQHAYSTDAAIAAQCVFDQGKFFEYHDLLFDRQKEWSILATAEEAQTTFTNYALELGVDSNAFSACVSSDSAADRVNEDLAEGRKADVGSTPTFFVNGERVTGTPFSANLKKAIDAALAESTQ